MDIGDERRFEIVSELMFNISLEIAVVPSRVYCFVEHRIYFVLPKLFIPSIRDVSTTSFSEYCHVCYCRLSFNSATSVNERFDR